MFAVNLSRILKTGTMVAALTVGGLALAQGPGGPHRAGPGGADGPGMMGGHVEHMLDDVDATEAQRAQVKKIMESARADLKGQRETSRKLHEQGMALFTAPTIDANAIESLRQQEQAQREIESKRISAAMIEAARVLTPEQRAKLADKMNKRMARMAEHMKKDRGAKPGQ